jgi:hypothetical protein
MTGTLANSATPPLSSSNCSLRQFCLNIFFICVKKSFYFNIIYTDLLMTYFVTQRRSLFYLHYMKNKMIRQTEKLVQARKVERGTRTENFNIQDFFMIVQALPTLIFLSHYSHTVFNTQMTQYSTFSSSQSQVKPRIVSVCLIASLSRVRHMSNHLRTLTVLLS